MKTGLLTLFLVVVPSLSLAKGPDCSQWPITMALVHLKNATITDDTKIDSGKTKAILLASDKVGRDRYRQIYRITFLEKNGDAIQVITDNQTSHDECSVSGVEVYVISKTLGGY